MFEGLSLTIIIIIFIALFYDFVNGWNDAANSVATVISTKVLTPLQAVGLAALMNFIAFLIVPPAVAATVGKGIVDVKIVTPTMILAGIISSIFWGVVMTYLGLPISMSHTLIGGLIGAGIARGFEVGRGFDVLIMSGIVKVVGFLILAPIIGLIFTVIFAVILFRSIRKFRPSIIHKVFGKLQLISVSWYSIGHGSNDALKTAGIITALLISVNYISKGDPTPGWVILSAYVAIALGTLIGGWRVIKTVGMRITHLRPVDGFCAESGGGLLLMITALLGIPVSTTHTITGAIMGIGATKRIRGVRWGVTRSIIAAWITTIPVTAIGGFLIYKVFNLLNIVIA